MLGLGFKVIGKAWACASGKGHVLGTFLGYDVTSSHLRRVIHDPDITIDSALD